MKTKKILSISLLTLIYASSCNSNKKSDLGIEGPERPNVLLIMTDDQGWGDITSHGNKIIETPHLDKLASESYRFNRFYVSPVCAPTRASLLTGRYHLRTGVNGVTGRKEVMRDSEYTIAELFSNNDYSTSCFGKWHNGAQFPHNPKGQGFDHFFGFSAGHWNRYHDPVLEYKGKMLETKGYITDIVTDSAIHFIKNHKHSPFFTYVAYNTPHTPSQVPDKYFDKYKNKGIEDDMLACTYAMCENIDDNVGRLLMTLEEADLSDNTIVIFLTDNGPNTWRFNGGMKGKKAWVDEGGVRVPLFIRIPWLSKKETYVNAICAHIDLMPTLSSLCNVDLPEGLVIDGENILKNMLNPEKTDNKRLLYTDRGLGSKVPFSIRSQKYLLTVSGDTMLFDIENDPGQKQDISGSNKDLMDSLIHEYNKWYREVTRFGFELIPIEIGHKNIALVRMPAHEAILTPELNYFEGHGWAHDWVKDFQKSSDTISWKLRVVGSGTYTAKLELSSPDMNKGYHIRLEYDDLISDSKLNRAYKSIAINTQDKVNRKEVPEKEWDAILFKNIKLTEGEYNLNLCLNKNLPGPLEIKGLELISEQ
jgi:arylsulfatase A-like enzyme